MDCISCTIRVSLCVLTMQIVERIEPSYVIRKYLDAQRIKNLTDFLEKLHEVPNHHVLPNSSD